MIPAHDSPLAALAFDASGTKLATASEKVCLRSCGKPGPMASTVRVTKQVFIFPNAQKSKMSLL